MDVLCPGRSAGRYWRLPGWSSMQLLQPQSGGRRESPSPARTSTGATEQHRHSGHYSGIIINIIFIVLLQDDTEHSNRISYLLFTGTPLKKRLHITISSTAVREFLALYDFILKIRGRVGWRTEWGQKAKVLRRWETVVMDHSAFSPLAQLNVEMLGNLRSSHLHCESVQGVLV